MSIQTFLASIANFFHFNGSAVAKLSRLKTAVEADYDAVVSRAESALAAGTDKVSVIAHTEAANLAASAARLAARAAALKNSGVTLTPGAGAKVDALVAGTLPTSK